MKKKNDIKEIKLKGIVACIGKASGRVVHVRSSQDISRVEKGDVVVTDKITSEYTLAFLKASAVISLRGGVTCHAAIICREYGIPSVVSCIEAFDLLNDGVVGCLETKKLSFTLVG